MTCEEWNGRPEYSAKPIVADGCLSRRQAVGGTHSVLRRDGEIFSFPFLPSPLPRPPFSLRCLSPLFPFKPRTLPSISLSIFPRPPLRPPVKKSRAFSRPCLSYLPVCFTLQFLTSLSTMQACLCIPAIEQKLVPIF